MNRIYSIITVLAAALLISGCNKYYDGIEDSENKYVEHNSRFLILRNYSSDDTVWFIPDKDCATTLPAVLDEWHKISVFEVEAHSSYDLTFDSTDNYVTPVETYGVNDKMVFYVFKKSVWEANDWATLVSGKMWSGKCELSVDDARALNGFVTYPMK